MTTNTWGWIRRAGSTVSARAVGNLAIVGVAAMAGFGPGPSAWGQGTLMFANRYVPGGVDAPVSRDAGIPVYGPVFLAQLLAGPRADALTAVGTPMTFSQPGYWEPSILTISGVAPGDSVMVQVRVWSTMLGPNYEDAVATGIYNGVSEVLSVSTGGLPPGGNSPPLLPGALTGLQPLRLKGVVPEPGVVVMLAMGGLVLMAGDRRSGKRQRP